MQGRAQDAEDNHLPKAGLCYVLVANYVLLILIARKMMMR